MEIALGFLLFFTLMILIGLILIGFYLYKLGKRTAASTDLLATKESDLIDLYQLLEQMINEFDEYIKSSKEDLAKNKKEILKAHSEMLILDEPESQDCVVIQPKPILKIYDNMSFNNNVSSRQQKDISVKSLYSQGKSIPEIAREMKIGRGEVQLILNIKKNVV